MSAELQQWLNDKHFCMTRFLEFVVNHWVLAGLWLATATALLAYISSKISGSLSPHQAIVLINKEEGVMVDVRERKEFDKGHVVDALNIPLSKLSDRVGELEKYKDRTIVVICQYGQQSGEAVKQLHAKGFAKVIKLGGGLSEWQAQSLPIVK